MKDETVGFQISFFSALKKLTAIFQLFILSIVIKSQLNASIPLDEAQKIRESIRDSLVHHYIIPDIVSVAPASFVTVMYSTFAVNMGNKVDPRFAQQTPSVWWPTEDGCLYTLLMIDSDVPSRRNPQYRSRQHWLVVNIPRVDIYKGKTLTEYIGPISPRNSGLHRNIFLVFKQKETITPDEPFISVINRGPNTRTRFSVRNFSAKYKLSDPMAINFFQAGYPIYKDKDERHAWYRRGETPPSHFVYPTNKPKANRTNPTGRGTWSHEAGITHAMDELTTI